MRFQSLRRCPHEIRCPVLFGGHPLYYLRPRSGVPVPVGGCVREAWCNRLLVDDGFPCRPHRRLCLRMEERRARMGLRPTAPSPRFAPPAPPAPPPLLYPSPPTPPRP